MEKKTRYGMNKETLDRGIQYMKEGIFGPEVTENLLGFFRAAGDDWEEQVACWTFGYIYERPGLELKTRVLLAITYSGSARSRRSRQIYREIVTELKAKG